MDTSAKPNDPRLSPRRADLEAKLCGARRQRGAAPASPALPPVAGPRLRTALPTLTRPSPERPEAPLLPTDPPAGTRRRGPGLAPPTIGRTSPRSLPFPGAEEGEGDPTATGPASPSARATLSPRPRLTGAPRRGRRGPRAGRVEARRQRRGLRGGGAAVRTGSAPSSCPDGGHGEGAGRGGRGGEGGGGEGGGRPLPAPLPGQPASSATASRCFRGRSCDLSPRPAERTDGGAGWTRLLRRRQRAGGAGRRAGPRRPPESPPPGRGSLAVAEGPGSCSGLTS